MKNSLYILVASLSCLLFSGCAGYAFSGRGVAQGSLYAGNNTNEQVTQNQVGTKKGESCASSILGLVTTGDASAASAAKKGGLTKITSVDNSFTNILGIYAEYCVVVSGE